jgi:hypothetical protein
MLTVPASSLFQSRLGLDDFLLTVTGEAAAVENKRDADPPALGQIGGMLGILSFGCIPGSFFGISRELFGFGHQGIEYDIVPECSAGDSFVPLFSGNDAASGPAVRRRLDAPVPPYAFPARKGTGERRSPEMHRRVECLWRYPGRECEMPECRKLPMM